MGNFKESVYEALKKKFKLEEEVRNLSPKASCFILYQKKPRKYFGFNLKEDQIYIKKPRIIRDYIRNTNFEGKLPDLRKGRLYIKLNEFNEYVEITH